MLTIVVIAHKSMDVALQKLERIASMFSDLDCVEILLSLNFNSIDRQSTLYANKTYNGIGAARRIRVSTTPSQLASVDHIAFILDLVKTPFVLLTPFDDGIDLGKFRELVLYMLKKETKYRVLSFQNTINWGGTEVSHDLGGLSDLSRFRRMIFFLENPTDLHIYFIWRTRFLRKLYNIAKKNGSWRMVSREYKGRRLALYLSVLCTYLTPVGYFLGTKNIVKFEISKDNSRSASRTLFLKLIDIQLCFLVFKLLFRRTSRTINFQVVRGYIRFCYYRIFHG